MKSFFSKTTSEVNPVKLKANVRMAVTRLRMQQNKLVNNVKIQRRQLAELLALQKYDAARIRVEQVIRDDVSIEGLEVLALFLDLVGNRIQLLTEKGSNAGHCPPELKESITSVLWASARVGDTVPELQAIKKYFENKYGKGFLAMSVSNAEFSVNQKIIDRLGMFTPSNASCVEYLTNVATEYGVEGYDEDKLRDSNGIVASAAATSGGALAGDVGATWKNDAATKAAVASGNVIKTPSGLLVPALTIPRDDLEWRLLQLKRE